MFSVMLVYRRNAKYYSVVPKFNETSNVCSQSVDFGMLIFFHINFYIIILQFSSLMKNISRESTLILKYATVHIYSAKL